MNPKQWKKRITKAEAIRRAGGRNRYNAERQRKQLLRRCALVQILSVQGDLQHGDQKILAEQFNVHKSVMSRDVAWARMKCKRNGMLGSGILPRFSIRGRNAGFNWVFLG